MGAGLADFLFIYFFTDYLHMCTVSQCMNPYTVMNIQLKKTTNTHTIVCVLSKEKVCCLFHSLHKHLHLHAHFPPLACPYLLARPTNI